MSASTVSVTANPRRRHALNHDQKSGLDLAGSDGIAVSPVAAAGRKDLSHSIRAGEDPRDGLQIKNPVPTKSPRRTAAKKSASSSSSKPPWKTVLSVLMKNFGLLLILLLLAQMIRRLAFNQGTPVVPSSDYERRIADVEAFLKTTTKMMQVQVEVVDRKIENEIVGLKTELNKRIDNKGAEFSTQLLELDGRVESMEKSLDRGTEWLSKSEFDRFLEEFKGARGFDGHKGLKLDEVRAFARGIVEKEIEKHAADGLGRVDYAVASGGAMVLEHSEPFGGVRRVSSWFHSNGVHSEAVKMLQPSFGEPGQCFALKGNSGFVNIKLRTAIIPEAITLEHVSKSVAFDRSSAPKECRVFGWLRDEKMHLLTEFVYDLERSSAQTFDTEAPTVVDTIKLEFTSNHGSPTHTCIYRFRVHGHQP